MTNRDGVDDDCLLADNFQCRASLFNPLLLSSMVSIFKGLRGITTMTADDVKIFSLNGVDIRLLRHRKLTLAIAKSMLRLLL